MAAMNSGLWIFSGTAIGFVGAVLLVVGLDGEGWALFVAWPVLYAAAIATSIGTIAAGIRVARDSG